MSRAAVRTLTSIAHKLYGSLPWEDVVMPVAKLARGWHVSRSLAGRLRMFGYVHTTYLIMLGPVEADLHSQFMLDSPTWKEVYAPRGYLAVEGDWIKREAYGRTLETVAQKGVDAFYNGKIADHMIDKLRSLGGVMTLRDVSPILGALCTGRVNADIV